MPSHGTSHYQEGLIIPPVRLYRAGEPNEDLIRLMARNSRMPDSLRGDLDAEVAACKMGAERIADLFRRYGREQVEACFWPSSSAPPRRSAASCSARSQTAPTSGKITPSMTASIRPASTPSG